METTATELKKYEAIRDTTRIQTPRMTREESQERRLAIMKLHYDEKLSLRTVGKRFGLSRQRIHQIINGE